MYICITLATILKRESMTSNLVGFSIVRNVINWMESPLFCISFPSFPSPTFFNFVAYIYASIACFASRMFLSSLYWSMTSIKFSISCLCSWIYLMHFSICTLRVLFPSISSIGVAIWNLLMIPIMSIWSKWSLKDLVRNRRLCNINVGNVGRTIRTSTLWEAIEINIWTLKISRWNSCRISWRFVLWIYLVGSYTSY